MKNITKGLTVLALLTCLTASAFAQGTMGTMSDSKMSSPMAGKMSDSKMSDPGGHSCGTATG